LDTAKDVIYGDREKTYGSPDKNLKLIASYWSDHISHTKGLPVVFTVDDVCIMMALLKLARLANDPTHKDSQLDVCGYMALMERCQEKGKVDLDALSTLAGALFKQAREEGNKEKDQHRFPQDVDPDRNKTVIARY
jgi:hypothetical protein